MIYEENAGQLGLGLVAFIGSGPDIARSLGPACVRLGLVRPMSDHIYEGTFLVGFKGSLGE